jgi:DNA-binding PadR family transcriptional regulator
MPATSRKRKIDIETLMELVETVDEESARQNLTTTRILKLTGVGSLHTVYRYVQFACDRGLMRLQAVQDPRPLGPAKYYYLTAVGERLLQAWKKTGKSSQRV